MTAWDATYYGAVSASRYEQWTFSLTDTTSFIVTAAITSGDLVPLITLSGNKSNQTLLQGRMLSASLSMESQ